MTQQASGEQPASNDYLIAELRDEIVRTGRIPFARFMDLALYHPVHGYYMSPDRRPGRGGDFLTAPELHPFFGLTVARQIAECRDHLDRPEPFTILEYGSGIGGLAYDVIAGLLHAEPEMRSSLRYRLNETNPHRLAQALTAMDEAGLGEIVTADVGEEPITGVILANEVADAMPVHRLRWTGTAFEEVWVGWDERAGFVDESGPLSPAMAAFEPVAYLERAGVDPASWPAGSRIEVSPAAASWAASLAARLRRGYAIVIDYGYPARELYAGHRLEGLLRVYGDHQVTDNPYEAVGERDLTAHVDFTLLAQAAEGAGLTVIGLATQSDFLANAGLGELLVDLQREPATAVDEYYRAQAAVYRLIDPGGMGRFRILGLAKNVPLDPPLRGFAGPELPASLRFEIEHEEVSDDQ
ncbi:MAG: SAM-dependent methyltransferase [Chloroflexia bacterium]|nr:SAM-dependent methyltransferase [Chloroflexia bacterium]